MSEEKNVTKPAKPIALMLEEAKQELVRTVNSLIQEKGLPAYLIEPYVADLHSQLLLVKQKELSSSAAMYEKQMAEFEAISAGKEKPEEVVDNDRS